MKTWLSIVVLAHLAATIASTAHDDPDEHEKADAGAVTRRALELVAAHEAYRVLVPHKLIFETSDQQRRTIDFFWNILDFRGRASDKTRWRNCNSVV